MSQRPNPDALLEKLQNEEKLHQRGRLKIFFGACAGVGKTYAMLSAAQSLYRQGVDVVVGVIETHRRLETEAQLKGLEIIPLKKIAYRDDALTELDLDAALQRKPYLILIDELAHTNAPGSRHPKRWQDIEELLAAGIHVFTSLNVQHLESLNDVVAQITGISVRETIPDHVLNEANEITLVDLPPEELLQRLKEGKVYVAEQVERAGKNFFRKGNLLALRELALRRTTDRVDSQMREYRQSQTIEQIWQTKERLIVCLGPDAEASNLVRAAVRLASSLHADLLAVYVETPKAQKYSVAKQERILKTLQLARTLGAEIITLNGTDVAQVLLAYARSRNISKLLIGKAQREPHQNTQGTAYENSVLSAVYWQTKCLRLMRYFRPSIRDALMRHVQDIDIYMVGLERVHSTESTLQDKDGWRESLEFESVLLRPHRKYIFTIAIIGLCTTFAGYFAQYFELSNVIMLYLLGVVFASFKYGRRAGVLASLLSVLSFDFCFVPPRWSLSVADTQYVLTFAIMLAVSLVISHLTANLRYQAQSALYRERRTVALYDLGLALAINDNPDYRYKQSLFVGSFPK